MPTTLELLAKYRRHDPPSVYNATTKHLEPISSATEDALILISTEAKRKAISYIDALLDFSPQTTPRDNLIKKAATFKEADLDNMLQEVSSMVDDYEIFKDQLSMAATELPDINIVNTADGMSPLLNSLASGLKTITDVQEEIKYMKVNIQYANDRYSINLSDDIKKEWRSWKRILATYMV